MATKRDTVNLVARYEELRSERQKIDDRLEEIEFKETGKRGRVNPFQRHPQAIEKEREDLKAERAKIDARMEELGKIDTAYDVGEPGAAEQTPTAKKAGVDTAYDVGTATPAEVAGAKPPAAEAGISGAAGSQPGGDYDINIGIGEGGEIVAPQGLTPEQLAIMVPGAFGAATPGQIKEAAERPSAPTAPPGSRPPKGFKPTDYSIEGRRRFEGQIIANQIGFNPISFNPMEYVNDAMRELPQLFNYVFRGQIMWADRNKLDKKQLGIWQNAVKTFRAAKLKEGNEMQEVGLRKYNYFMNAFDKEAATVAKNLESMRKAPKTMSFWDAEKGAMVLHERDPKTGEWKPTDKITSEPKGKKLGMPQNVKDSWSFVKSIGIQAGEDLGEPSTEGEASEKMRRIMELLGESETLTPEMRKLYDYHLKIVMDHFGISTEEAPTSAAPTIKYDKTGKRIQ